MISHHYDKPIGGIIENWDIKIAGERYVCTGELYDDPNEWYPDGYPITTSMLVWSEIAASKIETLHTRYKLGKAVLQSPDVPNEKATVSNLEIVQNEGMKK